MIVNERDVDIEPLFEYSANDPVLDPLAESGRVAEGFLGLGCYARRVDP